MLIISGVFHDKVTILIILECMSINRLNLGKLWFAKIKRELCYIIYKCWNYRDWC